MKGAICYLSSTGHTAIACQYIAEGLPETEFDRIDIKACRTPDLSNYSVLGFAFPTFYLGVEEVWKEFLNGLGEGRSKPCFLLNTYGVMQGQGLKITAGILEGKGYRIMASHAMMMQESFPPFLAKGLTGRGQPDDKQMASLNGFIDRLAVQIRGIADGSVPERSKVRLGFFNTIIGPKTRSKRLKEIASFRADQNLCTRCGACAETCLYRAVVIKDGPVFDMDRCQGCWYCFNHCPQKAITASGIDAALQYQGSDTELTGKFRQYSTKGLR